MPVTAIISAVKWGAVIALLTLALVTFRQFQSDQKNMRDTLITTSAEKISAQARSQELANANTQLEAALSITEQSIEVSRIAVEELKRQNATAQDVAATQQAVLDDVSRLQAVANKKTTLLERMSNRATKERFSELEALFNEI